MAFWYFALLAIYLKVGEGVYFQGPIVLQMSENKLHLYNEANAMLYLRAVCIDGGGTIYEAGYNGRWEDCPYMDKRCWTTDISHAKNGPYICNIMNGNKHITTGESISMWISRQETELTSNSYPATSVQTCGFWTNETGRYLINDMTRPIPHGFFGCTQRTIHIEYQMGGCKGSDLVNNLMVLGTQYQSLVNKIKDLSGWVHQLTCITSEESIGHAAGYWTGLPHGLRCCHIRGKGWTCNSNSTQCADGREPIYSKCVGANAFITELELCENHCQLSQCKIDDLPMHIAVIPSKSCYDNGEEVTFNCSGRLNGPDFNICENGAWEFPWVKCEANWCRRISQQAEMVVTPEKSIYPAFDTIEISCIDHYALSGPRDSTCSATGVWSTTTPVCLWECADECMSGVDLNKSTLSRPYRIGTTWLVACADGYQLANGDKTYIRACIDQHNFISECCPVDGCHSQCQKEVLPVTEANTEPPTTLTHMTDSTQKPVTNSAGKGLSTINWLSRNGYLQWQNLMAAFSMVGHVLTRSVKRQIPEEPVMNQTEVAPVYEYRGVYYLADNRPKGRKPGMPKVDITTMFLVIDIVILIFGSIAQAIIYCMGWTCNTAIVYTLLGLTVTTAGYIFEIGWAMGVHVSAAASCYRTQMVAWRNKGDRPRAYWGYRNVMLTFSGVIVISAKEVAAINFETISQYVWYAYTISLFIMIPYYLMVAYKFLTRNCSNCHAWVQITVLVGLSLLVLPGSAEGSRAGAFVGDCNSKELGSSFPDRVYHGPLINAFVQTKGRGGIRADCLSGRWLGDIPNITCCDMGEINPGKIFCNDSGDYGQTNWNMGCCTSTGGFQPSCNNSLRGPQTFDTVCQPLLTCQEQMDLNHQLRSQNNKKSAMIYLLIIVGLLYSLWKVLFWLSSFAFALLIIAESAVKGSRSRTAKWSMRILRLVCCPFRLVVTMGQVGKGSLQQMTINPWAEVIQTPEQKLMDQQPTTKRERTFTREPKRARLRSSSPKKRNKGRMGHGYRVGLATALISIITIMPCADGQIAVEIEYGDSDLTCGGTTCNLAKWIPDTIPLVPGFSVDYYLQPSSEALVKQAELVRLHVRSASASYTTQTLYHTTHIHCSPLIGGWCNHQPPMTGPTCGTLHYFTNTISCPTSACWSLKCIGVCGMDCAETFKSPIPYRVERLNDRTFMMDIGIYSQGQWDNYTLTPEFQKSLPFFEFDGLKNEFHEPYSNKLVIGGGETFECLANDVGAWDNIEQVGTLQCTSDISCQNCDIIEGIWKDHTWTTSCENYNCEYQTPKDHLGYLADENICRRAGRGAYQFKQGNHSAVYTGYIGLLDLRLKVDIQGLYKTEETVTLTYLTCNSVDGYYGAATTPQLSLTGIGPEGTLRCQTVGTGPSILNEYVKFAQGNFTLYIHTTMKEVSMTVDCGGIEVRCKGTLEEAGDAYRPGHTLYHDARTDPYPHDDNFWTNASWWFWGGFVKWVYGLHIADWFKKLFIILTQGLFMLLLCGVPIAFILVITICCCQRKRIGAELSAPQGSLWWTTYEAKDLIGAVWIKDYGVEAIYFLTKCTKIKYDDLPKEEHLKKKVSMKGRVKAKPMRTANYGVTEISEEEAIKAYQKKKLSIELKSEDKWVRTRAEGVEVDSVLQSLPDDLKSYLEKSHAWKDSDGTTHQFRLFFLEQGAIGECWLLATVVYLMMMDVSLTAETPGFTTFTSNIKGEIRVSHQTARNLAKLKSYAFGEGAEYIHVLELAVNTMTTLDGNNPMVLNEFLQGKKLKPLTYLKNKPLLACSSWWPLVSWLKGLPILGMHAYVIMPHTTPDGKSGWFVWEPNGVLTPNELYLTGTGGCFMPTWMVKSCMANYWEVTESYDSIAEYTSTHRKKDYWEVFGVLGNSGMVYTVYVKQGTGEKLAKMVNGATGLGCTFTYTGPDPMTEATRHYCDCKATL